MKNRKDIKTSLSNLKRKKKFIKVLRIVVIVLLLIIVIAYIIMRIIYNRGNFSITLDKNLYFDRGIIIYDDPEYKVYHEELLAGSVEYFDNISGKWLPNNLDQIDGSHNGENYVAYTFYIENRGDMASDYWGEVIIDDVIKNVDKAVRVRIYRNGEYTTYAKIGGNGRAERDTVPFTNDTLITTLHVEDFKPGDIDKYTVVMWMEGTDPDCNDNLLGGEIKVHMEFNSEFVEVLEKPRKK